MNQQNLDGEQSSEQRQNTATEQPPQIFKLNVDCFEKVFDYLSIKDLYSFGQTCTQMQRVVDHFYQQQLSNDVFRHDCEYVGFRKYVKNLHLAHYMGFDRNSVGTREQAKIVYLSGTWRLNLNDVDWNIFKSVEKITLEHFPDLEAIKMIPKEISNQIKNVVMQSCKMKSPLESFLELFANVKYLKICIDIDVDGWLTKNYPKLEHLTWYPSREKRRVDKLQTFFQQNPTIRSFSTFSTFLQMNIDSLMEVKLDDLYIFESERIECDLLNMLYVKGVYRQLHIDTFAIDQEDIDRFSSLKSLTELSMYHIVEKVDLSPLVNLKVLRFGREIDDFTNISALAQILENLNELEFRWASVDDILPFIHLSSKLKKIIIINGLLGTPPLSIIDPIAMNREREKLLAKTFHVSKVTIYMPEADYLATKWKTTETDLKLIEIQRFESWDQTKLPVL